mgnify:CR=1 FL=1
MGKNEVSQEVKPADIPPVQQEKSDLQPDIKPQDEKSEMKSSAVKYFLKNLPQESKSQALKLLNAIDHSSDINWTPSGRVRFKGKIIPQSDILRMTNAAISGSGDKFHRQAWQNFREALDSGSIVNRKRIGA